MKLYHSPTSPYVRKVMVTLDLTGQSGDVALIPGSGTPLAPNDATIAANPLGKIPCLIDDGGAAIFDSRVICRYLDQRVHSGLYPEGDALIPVLTAEALADGIIDAVLLTAYEWRLRPEAMRYQPWVDGQVAKVERALAVLEQTGLVLSGPLNAAQIAAGCALGYVDFRLADLGWRDRYPELAAWYAAFAATPAMKATVPAG
ncbi:MAG: glutathione S-transferase [Alphaproteobacteria bacterium]